MEKTINFFSDIGIAAYSAIILSVVYFVRWIFLKIKSLFVQDHWNNVKILVEEMLKPIKKQIESLQELSQKNEIQLTDLRKTQKEIFSSMKKNSSIEELKKSMEDLKILVINKEK